MSRKWELETECLDSLAVKRRETKLEVTVVGGATFLDETVTFSGEWERVDYTTQGKDNYQ